jgi:hypothetical protein
MALQFAIVCRCTLVACPKTQTTRNPPLRLNLACADGNDASDQSVQVVVTEYRTIDEEWTTRASCVQIRLCTLLQQLLEQQMYDGYGNRTVYTLS